MTGHISYDAALTRIDDMRRDATHRRVPRDASPAVATPAIAVRVGTEDDASVLARLAALDSAVVPSGGVLIAEVAGDAYAAIEVATGAVVADPFRRTADAVELLRVHAEQLRRGERPSRRVRPRWRAAYRTA